MKLAVLAVLCLFATSVAAIHKLPPGFNSPADLASVLANEPASASEARFAAAPGSSGLSSDSSIAFRDSESGDDDDGEMDAQIEQVNNDMKKLKENIKESEECARRLNEQQAELRSLDEQKDQLEKEKEKRILQVKLEKQMKDLSEINKMSRALRTKFAELKRTQKILKTKVTGTRTSLNQLDADPDISSEEARAQADNLASEMQSMQSAAQKILANANDKNAKDVKDALNMANSVHKAAQKDDLDV